MNDDARNGPVAFPSGDAEQLPAAGAETPVRNTPPARKLAWNRPTIRTMRLGRRTFSGAGGTNVQESGPYGVSWGDPPPMS